MLMNDYEAKILTEMMIESVNTNARIDALISMKLDVVEKEEFTAMAAKFRQERLVELLLKHGDFFSDDDEQFLRSEFD